MDVTITITINGIKVKQMIEENWALYVAGERYYFAEHARNDHDLLIADGWDILSENNADEDVSDWQQLTYQFNLHQ